MKNFSITGIMAFFGILLTFFILHGELKVPESELIFSHRLHVSDLEVECLDCHVTISTSNQAADKNIPTHEVCGDCHEDAIEGDDCRMCHANPENPIPVTVPSRKIVFSHKEHLARDIDCDNCHKGVKGMDRLTSVNMPVMETCSSCHDERTAPMDCFLCHINPEEIMRAAHPVGWRHSHKYEASRNDESCRTCHPNTDYCQDCHEGDNLRQTSHDLNYKFTHTLDAKGKEKDCMVCHTNQSFCNDCHQREEVMPTNHSSASWPRHDHGREAARDLESCAGCHDDEDPTCLRCHTDIDDIRGTDPSPHGPGFISERGKGPWHDDPAYFCYRCHRPGSQFREPGFCRYCHALLSDGNVDSPVAGGNNDAF